MNNQRQFYYLIGILMVQIVLHFVIGLIFTGTWILLGEVIFNVILAFIFAYLNYRGYRSEMWKDSNFHKSFGIYFLIFVALDLIWFFML